jgi:hypothetical protein
MISIIDICVKSLRKNFSKSDYEEVHHEETLDVSVKFQDHAKCVLKIYGRLHGHGLGLRLDSLLMIVET